MIKTTLTVIGGMCFVMGILYTLIGLITKTADKFFISSMFFVSGLTFVIIAMFIKDKNIDEVLQNTRQKLSKK